MEYSNSMKNEKTVGELLVQLEATVKEMSLQKCSDFDDANAFSYGWMLSALESVIAKNITGKMIEEIKFNIELAKMEIK